MTHNQKVLATTGGIMVVILAILGFQLYGNHQAKQRNLQVAKQTSRMAKANPNSATDDSSISDSSESSSASSSSVSSVAKPTKRPVKKVSQPQNTAMKPYPTNAKFGRDNAFDKKMTHLQFKQAVEQLQNRYLWATDKAKANETRPHLVDAIVQYEYLQLSSNPQANANTLTEALFPLTQKQSHGFYLNEKSVRYAVDHLPKSVEILYTIAKHQTKTVK